MKKHHAVWTAACFAAITWSTMAAENVQAPPIVAAEALTLSVSFNGSCDAELAAGRGKASETRGVIKYQDDAFGKALVIGKDAGCALFDSKDNLDFDHPGAIVFWFKSLGDWHKNPGPTITFWGLGNNKGYIGLRINSLAAPACPCRRPLVLAVYNSSKRRNCEYPLQPPALTKVCRNWHMASVAWAGEQLFLSYDGAPYRAYKLEKALSNEEFAHCPRFAVGQPGGMAYLTNNFRIYGKKLSDEELNKIWENGIAQATSGGVEQP